MPEGDTVHKLAVYLDEALRGQTVTEVRIQGRPSAELCGHAVEGITSEGKHLFMTFAGGRLLRVHLGLYGAWHRYDLGAAWLKPRQRASLVLTTSCQVFVCFNAKAIEPMTAGGFAVRDLSHRLGPDLTREPPPIESLLDRALTLLDPSVEVTDLLLDQRIASGIGNVYKSEVLFLEGCSPRARLGELSIERLTALYRTAGRLLMENLGGGPRTTRRVPDGRGILWVYGRAGLECLRCGMPIERAMLGRMPRSTYWCARCQCDGHMR